MAVEVLNWVFSQHWWLWFKTISSIGAPIVCVVGIVWFVYDRYTGGI